VRSASVYPESTVWALRSATSTSSSPRQQLVELRGREHGEPGGVDHVGEPLHKGRHHPTHLHPGNPPAVLLFSCPGQEGPQRTGKKWVAECHHTHAGGAGTPATRCTREEEAACNDPRADLAVELVVGYCVDVLALVPRGHGHGGSPAHQLHNPVLAQDLLRHCEVQSQVLRVPA